LNSLERRLVVGLAAVLLLVFAFLFWGSVTAVRSLAESQVLTRLEHDAEALLAAFGPNPRGQLRLREQRITPIYQQPLSGHYFVFAFDGEDRIRSRSLWDEGLSVDPLAPGAVTVQRLPGPAGQRLLVRSAGYEKAGRRFTLLVAEDLTPMARQIERFQWLVLVLLGLALLIVVLIQRLILRRGFASLDRVRAEITQVSGGAREQIGELGPSEVRPLTAEVNRLLRQLQQRLTRSRQALGNLAHALKAPLSLLTRDIETLPLADEERQRLDQRLQRIGQLIDRELKRARIAAGGAGQHFVPARHVPELIEALGQLHRARGLEIAVGTLPDHTLPLDYEDMLELLGNLLDNACKWAAGRVELAVSLDRDIRFVVADDGAGVADEAHQALLERGSRLDEQAAGHGLGLAIAKDLVDDYEGTIELGRSARLGGLEVRVRLPLAHGAGA
jgi:signal transduction histidine kinase